MRHSTCPVAAPPGASTPPLAATVLVTSLLLGLAAVGVARHEAWHGVALLHEIVRVLLAVAVVATAVPLIGPLRTAVLAVLSAGAAAAVVAPALQGLLLLPGHGEVLASSAAADSLWAPLAGPVAALSVAGRRLAPPWDRALPLVVVTSLSAAVLFRGQMSDVLGLVAVGTAAVLGPVVAPRPPRPRWQDLEAERARTTGAALLGALALGLVLGAPDTAVGVLAPVARAVAPLGTPVAVTLLVVATGGVLRGRRSGLGLAVVVLAGLTAVAAWRLSVEPVHDGWITWSDVPHDHLGWRLGLLLLWLVPLGVLVALVRQRRAFVGSGAAPAPRCEQDRLVAAIERGDAGTLGWMGTWEGTSTWSTPDGQGVVAYRACHGTALTVSDPACAPEDAAATILGFARECSRRALTPVFYSVHEHHRPTFERLGWTVAQIAEEAVLPLDGFTLSGRRRGDLRTAVNRAARDGVSATWARFAELDPELRAQLVDLSRDWAARKELPEMGFTLGGLPEMDDPAVRLLLAVDGDGRLHGVTSWLPVHRDGQLVGLTLDVLRRGGGRPMPGVMEFLITRACLDAADEGLELLSLSGTPLARSTGACPAPATGLRRLVDRGCGALGRTLEPAYGFTSLARFKSKFQPEHRPLLMACPSPVDLPVVGRALVRAYAPTLRFRQVLALAALARRAGQEQRAARRARASATPTDGQPAAGGGDGPAAGAQAQPAASSAARASRRGEYGTSTPRTTR
ncbi:bifunctional lysylphosphatidylglycerol flippase/synthetase MprF [Frigoribacterium salinisoli]